MIDFKKYSDPVLISLLKASDHGAYTEIYNRYYYLMFVFAYKKLRDEDLSKDFVQELFTNLWAKKEEVLETGNLAAYLYVTLRNKILDFFLHQKVEARYLTFLKNYTSSANNLNADYRIRENQLKNYIEKEIQALPTKMRIVFELSRKQNLSYQEIAKELDISENNVSKHINGAIKILRTKLGTIFTVVLVVWALIFLVQNFPISIY